MTWPVGGGGDDADHVRASRVYAESRPCWVQFLDGGFAVVREHERCRAPEQRGGCGRSGRGASATYSGCTCPPAMRLPNTSFHPVDDGAGGSEVGGQLHHIGSGTCSRAPIRCNISAAETSRSTYLGSPTVNSLPATSTAPAPGDDASGQGRAADRCPGTHRAAPAGHARARRRTAGSFSTFAAYTSRSWNSSRPVRSVGHPAWHKRS